MVRSKVVRLSMVERSPNLARLAEARDAPRGPSLASSKTMNPPSRETATMPSSDCEGLDPELTRLVSRAVPGWRIVGTSLMGSDDAAILQWAERNDRILLTEDVRTMPGHLRQHLQAGNRSPGVFMISAGSGLAQLVSCLELVAHAGQPSGI